MAISKLNQNAGHGTTPYSLTTTSSSTGSLMVVAVVCDVDYTSLSITDSQSQSYSNAVQGNDGSRYMSIWYFPNSASGVTSITITATGSGYIEASYFEFSGAATSSPIDVAGTYTSSSANTTTITTPNISTTVDGDVVVAAACAGG